MSIRNFVAQIRRSDLLSAVALASFFFLLYVPFVYRCGSGEADCDVMVAGIYQMSFPENAQAKGLYYFHSGQPLYNIAFAKLVAFTGMSFDTLLIMLNLLATCSMAVAAGALYYCSRQFDISRYGALTGTLTFMLAPFAFELSTYAHPQTLSIALIMVALACWIKAVALWPLPRNVAIALGGAAVVLGTAGLLVRMDGVLLLPLLFAWPLLQWRGWKSYGVMALGLPAAISLLALLLRKTMVHNGSGSGSDLLAGVISFANQYSSDGFRWLPLAFGTGGTIVLIACLLGGMLNSKYRAVGAALVALVPLLFYCSFNAAVPRRFVHLFVVAGAAVALLNQFLGTHTVSPIPVRRDKEQKRRAKKRTPITQAKASTSLVPDAGIPRVFVILMAILIIGNWVLWPIYGQLSRMVGDPPPSTVYSKALVQFMPARHHEQQRFYCWEKQAMADLTSRLKSPHDLIGGWLEYGCLLAGYCRNKIPVSISQSDIKPGRPQLTYITAAGVTHVQYGPPWDYPPGQQTPAVILLNNYKQDVTWGLKNIKAVAPPPGLTYHIW